MLPQPEKNPQKKYPLSRIFASEKRTMNQHFISNEITVGNLPLGGNQPVRIQSMTNTPTQDTEATVNQIIRLAKAGCELVRIAAADVKEAENLKNIRNLLRQKGVDIPLIADIHFQPKTAEIAAGIVDKIRINPGNFTGSHHKNKKYSEEEYHQELRNTAANLKPLFNICEKNHTTIRIGINHGSLSDRILYRYGNTPEGMVSSALEFIQICRENNFHNLTLSLKASSVPVMIKANRLLVEKMKQHGWNYPIHLGVTEAGSGTEGRIKSIMGIGTLLSEGIGDTLRVSLTEAPEKEIPVARKIIRTYPRHFVFPGNTIQQIRYGEIENHLRPFVVWIKENETPDAEKKVCLLSYPDLQMDEILFRAPVDFFRTWEQEKPDGLLILHRKNNTEESDTTLAFQILQAAGLRFSQAEFIACPSCGRTQFDIETELQRVQKRLGHLKGLKIAIMGCFVNGPGEMAGADYGYVGTGKGKVNLYKKNKIIFKHLSPDEALNKLEELILNPNSVPENES